MLTAPGIESTIPAWKRLAARVLGRVAPGAYLANGLRGDQLATDPAVGADYVADPLNEHRTSVGFGAAGIAEQARVLARLHSLSIPTLVMHGTADTIVPPSASSRLGALPGVTLRTWPGLRHEIHNEPAGGEVVAAVVAWIEDRMGRGSG